MCLFRNLPRCRSKESRQASRLLKENQQISSRYQEPRIPSLLSLSLAGGFPRPGRSWPNNHPARCHGVVNQIHGGSAAKIRSPVNLLDGATGSHGPRTTNAALIHFPRALTELGSRRANQQHPVEVFTIVHSSLMMALGGVWPCLGSPPTLQQQQDRQRTCLPPLSPLPRSIQSELSAHFGE